MILGKIMKKQNKPDFLIVGAGKSGTTSLFHYLDENSKIHIPEFKECRFFSQMPQETRVLGGVNNLNDRVENPEDYFNLFFNCQDKVCGDISPDYLYYYEESIKNIKKYLDDSVKIIIILRNPVDRAYSLYAHRIKDGTENLSFEKGVEVENDRIKNNWMWGYHYVHSSFYYDAVKAYKDNFPNVKVYLFEDLLHDENFFDDLCGFIGVEPHKMPDKKYNVSGHPKNKFIHKFLTEEKFPLRRALAPVVKLFLSDYQIEKMMGVAKGKNLKKVPMKPETRDMLKKTFREDIIKLEKLIDRDLSAWL